MKKLNILFVGAFKKKTKDGSTGGMHFACDTIINSSISDTVNWILLDSTPSSNLKRSLLKRSISAIIRLFKYFAILMTKKVDFVLIFTSHGGSFIEKGLMAIVAKKFGKKVILSSRAGAIKDQIINSKLMAKYARLVFRSTDKVLCQSKLWKTFFSKYAKDKEKFVVIENWIDTSKYSVNKVEKFDRFTLLFMAWVIDEKGIFELLEAKKILEQNGHDFDLLICGGGDHLQKAQKIVEDKKIDSVIFKGWIHGIDKLDLFYRSHAFILPSHYEGFSNSLLEAMASGLPVISTTVGSAPDIIEDKENGLLIKLKDPVSIASALEYCIENPEQRIKMGLSAQKKVLRDNSIDTAVNAVNQLIMGLSVKE